MKTLLDFLGTTNGVFRKVGSVKEEREFNRKRNKQLVKALSTPCDCFDCYEERKNYGKSKIIKTKCNAVSGSCMVGKTKS